MRLNGATALVTGANRGIGRALVERLASEPVHAILAGVRSVESFEPVAETVRPVRVDLSSRRRSTPAARNWVMRSDRSMCCSTTPDSSPEACSKNRTSISCTRCSRSALSASPISARA